MRPPYFRESRKCWYILHRGRNIRLPDHHLPRDLADEIPQETFLDAAHVAEPIECAGNWLYGLMWQQIDRIRERERRRRRVA